MLKLVSRNENYGLNFIPQIMEFKTEFQAGFLILHFMKMNVFQLIAIRWMDSYKWKY